MEYSQTGLTLTEQFESCALTAYRDIKGILTIGWGHTGPDVTDGQTITQTQADALLLQDVHQAVNCVNRVVTVPLTQNEFDSLCDFCYNCGCEAFASSTMLRLLNQQQYAAAAAEFEKWDHAAGVVIAGLLRRRKAEEDLFDTNYQQ